MMNWRFARAVLASLLIVSPLAVLQGCWEENEPNNDPEEAYWSGQHVQLWSGDWNWPDPGTLPMANGQGNVSWSDSVDNWPISMWNWVDGEYSDATSFVGTLWLSADAEVSVDWYAWRGGNYSDAVWEPFQETQSFSAPADVKTSVYTFHLHVDGLTTLYSMQFSGKGDYGFILVPVYE